MAFRKNRFRPTIESLEQRELLAANLAAHVMPVTAQKTLVSEQFTLNYVKTVMITGTNLSDATAVDIGTTGVTNWIHLPRHLN
jgi:hypothetical protein